MSRYTTSLDPSGSGVILDEEVFLAELETLYDATKVATKLNAHDALVEFLNNARAHALAGNQTEVYAEMRGDFCGELLKLTDQ